MICFDLRVLSPEDEMAAGSSKAEHSQAPCTNDKDIMETANSDDCSPGRRQDSGTGANQVLVPHSSRFNPLAKYRWDFSRAQSDIIPTIARPLA